MPDGITHHRTTLALSVPVFALVYLKTDDLSLAGASLVGNLLTTVLSPDRDLPHAYGCWIIKKNFGGLAHNLWDLYWKLYETSVPHRSFLSHSYFFSTFVRLVYLFWPIFLIFYILNIEPPLELWLFFYLGAAFSDCVHITLDEIVSRLRNQRG